MSRTYAWAPITKAERQDDGSVVVTGLMTDSGRDRDGQGMNQQWLDEAVPAWFNESGNIREMHDRHSAAGVGIGLVRSDDGGYMLQARITDPTAATKCLPAAEGERPVYQGFSIGVREPRISFEKAEFPGGEVVGGYLCETSLADRPSNPRTVFTMVKADDDGSPVVVEVPEEVDPEQLDPEPDDETDGDAAAEDTGKADGPVLTKNWAEWDAAHAAGGLSKGARVKANHPEHGQVTGVVTGQSGDKMHLLTKGHGAVSVTSKQVTHVRSDTTGGGARAAAASRDASERAAAQARPGGAAAGLDPATRDAARLARQRRENITAGAQAGGAAEFQAAIDQANRAAGRKTDDPDLFKFVSKDQRTQYASTGVALPNGDFPIPDKGHLSAALGLLSSYKGDKAAAKAHILKRAKALGVDVDASKLGKSDAWSELSAGLSVLFGAGGLSKYDEADDIAGGRDAIAAIARLIQSEAAELANGRFEEIQDICTLIDAAKSLTYFVRSETNQAQAGPDADTSLTGATYTQDPDLEKTDGEDGLDMGSLSKADLADMLKTAVTQATKATVDELALVKSQLAKVLEMPLPGGPVQTRTSTQAGLARTTEVETIRREAQSWLSKADEIGNTDPVLAEGYREQGETLLRRLAKM
jgi:hypothetical protein